MLRQLPSKPTYTVGKFGSFELRLTQAQVTTLTTLSFVLLYLSLRQPPLEAILISGAMTVIGCTFLPSVAAKLPRRKRLALQRVSTVVLTLLMVLQVQPVYAQFFNALEQATTEVVSGSNSGIDTAVITIIFVLFRVLVVLAFVAGVVGLLVQSFRGGDWQPIASMIGIGLAFVIGVEVITNLMLGGAGGAG